MDTRGRYRRLLHSNQTDPALQKQIKQFSAELFACEADAHKAFRRHRKAHPLFMLTPSVVPVEKHEKAGRPKKGEAKQCVGYQIQVQIQRNDGAIQGQLQTKGRFILATNDGDKEAYPDQHILADYKAQQTVENGFRFLKNPDFLADTLFLKSQQRIAAFDDGNDFMSDGLQPRAVSGASQTQGRRPQPAQSTGQTHQHAYLEMDISIDGGHCVCTYLRS